MVPNIGPLFTELEDSIFKSFFSKIFGEKLLLQIRNWVSVLIRQGGTTILKPEEMADLNYQVSTCECSHLFDSLKNREMFYTDAMVAVRVRIKEEKRMKADKILDGLKNKINKFGARKLDYLREKGTGT